MCQVQERCDCQESKYPPNHFVSTVEKSYATLNCVTIDILTQHTIFGFLPGSLGHLGPPNLYNLQKTPEKFQRLQEGSGDDLNEYTIAPR